MHFQEDDDSDEEVIEYVFKDFRGFGQSGSVFIKFENGRGGGRPKRMDKGRGGGGRRKGKHPGGKGPTVSFCDQFDTSVWGDASRWDFKKQSNKHERGRQKRNSKKKPHHHR